MTHSLEAAVLDGTISETIMQDGLTNLDLERLGESYGSAQILVHLRNDAGASQIVMSVDELLAWHGAPTPRIVRSTWWYREHIVGVWPFTELP